MRQAVVNGVLSAAILSVVGMTGRLCRAQVGAPLPKGVTAVWDLDRAHRKVTPTRERICINGLWRWQPTEAKNQKVPTDRWGYFKVPGCWPGITDYMQKDCQMVHAPRSWGNWNPAGVTAAWYQREITIPARWSGRRIVLNAEYLNSYATVYWDGDQVGEMRFPAGEVELTSVCRPGQKHVLSMLVVAMPLQGVMLSYSDSNSAREVKGTVRRRGLCGDVYLVSTPNGARLDDVKVDTSVRNKKITFESALLGLSADEQYALRARVSKNGRSVAEFMSKILDPSDVHDGRIAFTEKWQAERLWDTHTPENQYEVSMSLFDADGKVLDEALPVRFGFREFWIDGRDFYLNGTRIFLSAVPLDNAQVGAAWAAYDGARESLKRLQSFGINAVYTHNYGCEPGSHLSFAEILRAADDVGMLVCLSQPHFSHYDWEKEDANRTNGYAKHAEFYVRIAQNHPAVVMYSMSHNATGYNEDMNPDMIDGLRHARSEWSERNAQRAVRAEAIVRRLDPSRIVYHHSSGNLGPMHTSNFYPNWVPIQEMSDWFEHWATEGVKPFFACEYGAPFMWDWAMYRGWYMGSRSFGSAVVPWDFCLAEWNAQFLGDRAFQISEEEKSNLRWEARQFDEGRLWHRWDYPHHLGSRDFDERYPILANYLTDNWRAFRTWGVSATSPWEHAVFWKLRPNMERNQQIELETDWEQLQRPGLSPDYLLERYERMDLAYQRADWIATPAADALYRNNGPLLSYLAGKPSRFTSKDHNFLPGETVEKQIVVINNSRETVTAHCAWSFGLPEPVTAKKSVTVATGGQARIPLGVDLPSDLQPGRYILSAAVRFNTGETQKDRFVTHVLPAPVAPESAPEIALFDPKGETRGLLTAMDVRCDSVQASTDLSKYGLLIIGKGALTPEGPAPDIMCVRNGLKVIVFEQTSEALEKRLGFRVAEYGLRNVFRRVPDHPYLAGLDEEHLRDWRGEATILPPRLDYQPSDKYNGVPAVRWCGLEVPRLWRCGNRGNVASVLIEKPTVGDFLPIIDGGFSLQYSPLLEYREGRGMVLFCQMDVTGRTEEDPAAMRLVRNILTHVSTTPYPVCPTRKALYVGEDAGKRHLERAGISPDSCEGGELARDQVLIVGSRGGQTLAKHAQAVARWLKTGGHLLALELDAQEANTFSLTRIDTTEQEHIAAHFEPPSVGSPFAGVGPADVHNRDPRKLPLISGGATIVGNGVLARAKNANVVFCQLAAYSFIRSPGDVPGFTVDGEDAVEGEESARLTMGTVPWAQFGQKVTAGQVGKTYTFAACAKALREPVTVRLEVERAGSPWDRVVRGQDIELPANRWTDLYVSFKVDKPYPQGWSAYIHCGHPEAELRVDRFELYEGSYSPRRADSKVRVTAGIKNVFANPGFEKGEKPWFFNWKTEQQNLRKTFRRSSFLLSRLLANMGVRGRTPLLRRFSTPTTGMPRASVLQNGDFRLDADDMPDHWQFSTNLKDASCSLEVGESDTARPCLRIVCPESGGVERGSVMLAQHDVAVREGQWYLISLNAKAKGLDGTRITLALQDTTTWRSLFDYQRFAPREAWKEYVFLVQANATATSRTRFQIWHDGAGTLWLSDVRMAPCDPPSQGRWTNGLYVDKPQEWDDPYRFFRW